MIKDDKSTVKIEYKKTSNLYKVFGIIFILATFIIALVSIHLPSELINSKSKETLDDVNVVPREYYSGPSTAVVKNASRQLSSYQRLQLITGDLSSTLSPASSEECAITEYEAYLMAENILSDLYETGVYPDYIPSNYQNWYTWKAAPYKALDTNFQIYAAIYWVVSLERFDGTESHTIVIDEAGELIAVSYNGSNTKNPFKPAATALQFFKDDFINADIKSEEDVTYTDINELYMENYHIDTPDDTDDIKASMYSITTNSKEKETYNLYTIRGNEYFSIFITP